MVTMDLNVYMSVQVALPILAMETEHVTQLQAHVHVMMEPNLVLIVLLVKMADLVPIAP
jgi:hypothetical protein